MGKPRYAILPALFASVLLAACGGGNDGSGNASASSNTTQPSANAQEAGAPQSTGNTATDGFNWFNFRRQQAGVAALARSAIIDTAAQAHSDYQKGINSITHDETAGTRGFTGETVSQRLPAAGYRFTAANIVGEVIAATFSNSGFNAAEDLITAIYHRFVILEPMFKEGGAGSATVEGGHTYFTVNFAANGLDRRLGASRVVVYPFAGQQGVLTNFFSDNEAPDPVPDRNEVGYPVSVHADFTSTVTVKNFTVRPRGGSPLAVRLLTSSEDDNTPPSVAAIVPLQTLAPASTYDVEFAGTVDGVDVSRAWSFTTR